MEDKQTPRSQDREALLREVNDVLGQVFREKQLVVMAQSQLAPLPGERPASSHDLKSLKTRMEDLPDFGEQMAADQHFRETYRRLLAALKL